MHGEYLLDVTRGYYKMQLNRFLKDSECWSWKKFVFTLKDVDDWNALPEWIVAFASVQEFESKLGKYWKIQEFRVSNKKTSTVYPILFTMCKQYQYSKMKKISFQCVLNYQGDA